MPSWDNEGGRPINPDQEGAATHGIDVDGFILGQKKIALDCGIDPNDGLLVAWLPKLDAVLQEAHNGNLTAHSLDGILLDVTGPKPVRWWQVRGAAGDLGLALPDVVWQGRARDFSLSSMDDICEQKPSPGHDYRLYMRAYSHGPWICIEPDQLAKVYEDERTE